MWWCLQVITWHLKTRETVRGRAQGSMGHRATCTTVIPE